MPQSRPTIRDVARLAGVSHQTVSRVINESDNVLSETRDRVETAIAELGYRPSAIARSMARGLTHTLACISPNLTDFTFASIIEGAELEARRLGYFLLSSSAHDSESFGELVEELIGHRRIDGLIVMNPYADERHQHISSNFPVVFVGARSHNEMISSVSLDDEKAAYDATRHLISLGHHQIAMVTGPVIEDCTSDRFNGYESALRDAGIPLNPNWIVEGDWSASSGQQSLLHLSRQSQLPTAVFAQNDRMALGILHAAKDLGLRVPEELAVIGIDDMPLSSHFDPPLTTMKQDMSQIGVEAVRILIQTINENTDISQQIKLPAELVIRKSTYKEGGD